MEIETNDEQYIIDKEIRVLNADEIECRIGMVNAKGCSLLLYKDARVDMKILDETYGRGNWQRTHEVINDNLFCNILIWNDKIQEWVKKQDVGIESRPDGSGNERKGEASDSFKRAGFNVGIGRELYTAPFIWILPKNKEMGIKVKSTDEKTGEVSEVLKEFYINSKGKFETKTRFKVSEIGYNDNREINKLVIIDNKGNVRLSIIPEDEQKNMLENMPITEGQKQQIKDKYTPDKIKNYLQVIVGKQKLSYLTYKEAEEFINADNSQN